LNLSLINKQVTFFYSTAIWYHSWFKPSTILIGIGSIVYNTRYPYDKNDTWSIDSVSNMI